MNIVTQETSGNSEPQAAQSSALFFIAVTGIVALYLSLALYRISELPLIDPDEPRYATAGRNMARGGSLLVPEFNGRPRINKPPLFYWLVALSDNIAGNATEASSRAPSVVLGLLMLLGTILLGRRVYGNKTALIGGLVLATTPLFFVLARCCITDMTVSTFMAGSLAFLMLAMLQLGPPRHLVWVASIWLGLAVLTKATPALAVVLAVLIERMLSLSGETRKKMLSLLALILLAAMIFSAIAVFKEGTAVDKICNSTSLVLSGAAVLLIVYSAWQAGAGTLAQTNYVMGFLLALAMGLWWYIALIHFKGWTEFKALLEFEVAQRLAGAVHREPMHYYLMIVPMVSIPWAIGLPGAMATAFRCQTPETMHTRADRFLLAWMLGIVFFFSIPGAKLATYVLGAMPAVALLIARFIVRLQEESERIPALAKPITLGLAGVLCIGLLLLPLFKNNLPLIVQAFAAELPLPAPTVFGGFGICVIVGWILAQQKLSVPSTVLTAGATAWLIFLVMPAAIKNFLAPRSTRELCAMVRPKLSDCERLACVGDEIESLVYYMEAPVYETRRRRVVQRRKPLHNPTEPAVTEDEPYDAVMKEELSAPMKVGLFVPDRFYCKLLNVKTQDFREMSDEEIVKNLPPNWKFVGRGRNIVVIRNDK